MLDSKPLLIKTDFPKIQRGTLDTLQVNLGYTCNQTCKHCHVNAGPNRTEQMSLENIDIILSILKNNNIKKLDLTGGAPELMPHFKYLVSQAYDMGITTIDRCNLTILNEPEQTDLAEFLAEKKVEVVASLPCYTKDNVDKQRGNGVFESSIIGLKKLNSLGYGKDDSNLKLDLMYNPSGAFLPPEQSKLEIEYKRKLQVNFGIVFSHLYTLINMPISRFGSSLMSSGEFEPYIDTLKNAYCADNLNTLMCKKLISIDWQGYIYDCDFNQMLEMPSKILAHKKTHVSELNIDKLINNNIITGDHCYGCTAGNGSSCGGSLS